MGSRLPQSRALPQRGSRRAVDVLFLQGSILEEENQNHKLNRKEVSRGTQENKTDGGLFGQNQCGENPLRGVLLRKQTTGNCYPFPCDTKLLTLARGTGVQVRN